MRFVICSHIIFDESHNKKLLYSILYVYLYDDGIGPFSLLDEHKIEIKTNK